MKEISTRTVLLPYQHRIPRVEQFGHYRYARANPGLETHFHADMIEICYCLDGVQQYIVEGHRHYLKGGDILIVPPNRAHDTGGMPEEKGELYWIQLKLSGQGEKLCHLPQTKSGLLLRRLEEASNIPFRGAQQVKELLVELFALSTHKAMDLGEIRREALLLRLLLDTLDLSQRKLDTEVSQRVILIDDFIEKNLYRNMYVDELADLIQVSTGYFKAWFKLNTGNTPKEYINRKRMEKAKEILPMESSVTEVAYALGFNSSQYFSTVFRKYTGKSPREYIQELKKVRED
ncbi:helix-turn-helix domain-containing protein [Flagellimonas olearia]|uniref:HTH araC/xylS-type domain-containing protein n=1 Tax=Flagellimonas olearia TaxID=552546 RepID=A0A444VR69_9FLAO|nr:helix-turn-helix domain-containing protein [Allomuricauda olearia]RYC53120.1 hypothetical protein DN53_02560 [Allomuricauda olearia]